MSEELVLYPKYSEWLNQIVEKQNYLNKINNLQILKNIKYLSYKEDEILQYLLIYMDILEVFQSINTKLRSYITDTNPSLLVKQTDWVRYLDHIKQEELNTFSFLNNLPEDISPKYQDSRIIASDLYRLFTKNLIELVDIKNSYPNPSLTAKRSDIISQILPELKKLNISALFKKSESNDTHFKYELYHFSPKKEFLLIGENDSLNYITQLTITDNQPTSSFVTLLKVQLQSKDLSEIIDQICSFITSQLAKVKKPEPPITTIPPTPKTPKSEPIPPKPTIPSKPKPLADFKVGDNVVVWQSLTSKFKARIIDVKQKWISVSGNNNGKSIACRVRPEILSLSETEIPALYQTALDFDFEKSGIVSESQLQKLLIATKSLIAPIINQIFDSMQKIKFESVSIQWGDRMTFRNLGWYKNSANLIQISKSLQNTPDYVIQKTIWHELLHIKYNPGQGEKAHSSQFRFYEAKYPQFNDAKEFVEKYYSKLRIEK